MKWKTIGHIGIDAGICWIGDPCYIMPDHNGKIKTRWKNWREFCDELSKLEGDDHKPHATFPYDMGHEGLGVCVSTGFGDGYYPVQAKLNEEGRVAEVRIKFI